MFWHDVRFGARMLRRDPVFTAVAVVTLALGIGANTAIFTLFDAVLLRTLPVREAHRLVLFSDGGGEGTSIGSLPSNRWERFSLEAFRFLHDQRLPFDSMAAVRSGESPVSVRLPDAPQTERARVHLVSGNFFDVMGAPAALGRTLTMADDRPSAAPSAVVSHAFWTERLRGDRGRVGTVATINGVGYTIVGVAPREFFGERVRRPPDLWVPLSFQPQIEMRQSYLDRSDAYWLSLIARLPPGVDRLQAQTAATTALQQFLTAKAGASPTAERVQTIRESRVQLADGSGGISSLRLRYAAPLRVLLVVVALVLLIACANVGNLLLSRAAARRGEITVRVALGAGRARIVRQLLTESMLLAALGAGCGIVLARWAVDALLALMVSRGSPVHAALDARILAFTIGVAAVAGIAFGLAPALTAGRADLAAALKTRGSGGAGGPGAAGFTRFLVIAQIAASLILLVGANLFVRSLVNLESQPLGFEQDHVLLARINPRLAGYTPDSAAALYRRLYDRLGTMSGVRSVTIARYSPLGGSRSLNSGFVEGYTPKPDEDMDLETIQVGPNYPATLGIPLVQGRALGPQDVAGAARAGMVNQAFVRKFFPDRSPIGRHVGISDSRREPDIEIVGVVGDARFQNSQEPIGPQIFPALLQEATQFGLDAEVEIRTSGEPAAAAGELRRAIADVDRNLPVDDPQTLREQVASNFNSQRLAARLIGAFGGLALVLACVGLYGVIAQSVARRTNEIGMRMALGAQRGDVIWMIFRDVLVMLAVGLAVGVPAAIGSMRLVASQIYGLGAAAPWSFAWALAILAAVALATGFMPARRATRLDPLKALRDE